MKTHLKNPPVSLFSLALLATLGLAGCADDSVTDDRLSSAGQQASGADWPSPDLDEILERGSLRAIINYSSTGYFIYKGQPMGFEYELAVLLAEHLGLELEVVSAVDLEELFAKLERGEGDVIAQNLTVTKRRMQRVAFTRTHTPTQQVLVQRKPADWRRMKSHQIEKKLVRSPLGLIGKSVHVREDSVYQHRLENLSEEIGADIRIVTHPGTISTEQLIRMVARGEIDYTVANQDVAYINRAYSRNLDVKTEISLLQRNAWAVRKDNPELLAAIDAWIEQIKKSADYYVLYNKYFKAPKDYRRRISSDYYANSTGRISRYDDLIKEHADELGWDWRLLASMVYQESQFDPKAESWAGARGLMQLMPATAERMGVRDAFHPRDNIRGGVAYLARLQDRFSHIEVPAERTKFVLASYNAGPGHVEDAQRLADKYTQQPQVWDGVVDFFLRKLSEPRFFRDEVVRYGYCRGLEPFTYVNEVLARYQHYLKLVPDNSGPEPPQPAPPGTGADHGKSQGEEEASDPDAPAR